MKKFVSIVMVLVTVFTIVAVSLVPASAAKEVSVSEGVYVIESKLKKNMVLDVAGGSKKSGANIQLYKSNGTTSQLFWVKKSGSYYTITALNSYMVLDVENGNIKSGTNVQQYTFNNTSAQKWKFYDAGNGYYYIACGNYALDVSGGVANNKTNVQIYKPNSTASQAWKLVKKYADYNGLDYRKLTSNKNRLAALDKAKMMVTVLWKAPCDFVTWASSEGVYNKVTSEDGKTSTKFIKGKTYSGIPYSMNNHSYDDEKWIELVDEGFSSSSMKKTYKTQKKTYPKAGTAKGIDCSYFVYTAIKATGKKIDYEYTGAMIDSTYYKKLSSYSKLQPGDLLLKNGHVMMFVGKTSSGKYAVFEACADDSKSSYNVYSYKSISSYSPYTFKSY